MVISKLTSTALLEDKPCNAVAAFACQVIAIKTID